MVRDKGRSILNDQKVISEQFIEENFPELWKYVSPQEVTDIDFNCGNLWISKTNEATQQIQDEVITEKYMQNVAQSLALFSGKAFNAKEILSIMESLHSLEVGMV